MSTGTDFIQCTEPLPKSGLRTIVSRTTLGFLFLGGLYASSVYSYLLFHTLSEIFAVVVGCGIFMVAWNARHFLQNNYLLFVGVAFLPVATLDLAHALAYKGMGILPGLDSDPPTQLWVAARFTQSLAFLIAPAMLHRSLKAGIVLASCSTVAAVLLFSVLWWDIFPECYVEGRGLTTFKVVAEYLICLMLLGSMALLYRSRQFFDARVLQLLLWAIGLTVAAEVAFTSYVSVYGTFNLIGHLLKILAFYLIYKAIIETGISPPHKLLMRQLSQSEERYRLLFNLSPDPIFSVDSHGRFLVANPACETLSGYSSRELLQRTFAELCAPDQLAATIESFQKNIRDATYSQLETALIRKDGRRVHVWVAGQPLEIEGKILAVYCTAKDISERKEFQAELERKVRERTAKLQELVAELEHFSYTLTHDMRAPLRAMHGFGSILMEQTAPSLAPEARGFLESIMSSAARMDRLIVDALRYSKAVMNELPLGRVEPELLLKGIIDSYPDLTASKAEIWIEGQIPPVIANEAGLTQCCSNLLNNAVKFVQPGRTPKVRVWAEIHAVSSLRGSTGPTEGVSRPAEPDVPDSTSAPPETMRVVRIWFEDNGIGISPQMQERLFQMFQRASKDYEGTGIGLALVRKVAERMNGRVGVESTLGQGSRFWLELQLADQ